MSPELAQELAEEAMSASLSTRGDALMTLSQARARMDIVTVLPSAPIRILDEVLTLFWVLLMFLCLFEANDCLVGNLFI